MFELVDKSNENTEGNHKRVLADSGFCNYKILQEAEENRKEDIYIPDKRFQAIESGQTSKGAYDLSEFKIRKNGVRCPEGYKMKLWQINDNFDDGHSVKIYAGINCDNCHVKKQCTRSETGRKAAIDSRYKYQKKMRDKLRKDKGREIYMRRQAIVECPHGNDQKNRGWTQHYLRGLKKAGLEFLLIRIASNLEKIINYKAKDVLAMSKI